MGPTLFGSTMSKNRLQFFTPAYYLMITIQGNSSRNIIASQLCEDFSNASIKIAQLVLFLKSTCALVKSCIPQEKKLVSSSKIRVSLLNMIYFSSLRMQPHACMHFIISYCGKPNEGTTAYYVKGVKEKVKYLIQSLQNYGDLQECNISFDRLYTSVSPVL